MQERVIVVLSLGFILCLAACWQPGAPVAGGWEVWLAAESAAVPPGRLGAASQPELAAFAPERDLRLASTRPITPAEPRIPAILERLYLGIPAGNGDRPYRIAVDDQRRRAYTLNYGTLAAGGNTVSVLDLETGEITALIRLDNVQPGDFSPPDPLDVQVDPYRPRLYVVWGDRYAEVTDSTLTIIDTQALTVTRTLPGVEAMAAGPSRLYLANDTRLWAADPNTLAELEGTDLDPRQFNQPLLLNPRVNRLYLGRGRPWSLEVFAADGLAHVSSYSLSDWLIRAAVDVPSGRLIILESDGQQVYLRALDADGRPLARPAPVPVSDNVYSDLPLALDEHTVYLAGGDYEDYRLDAYSLPNLAPFESVSLPTQPYDLDVDTATGLVYAAYSSWSSYVQGIDLTRGPVTTRYTARAISDVQSDPAAGRLYVLDDAGALRVLSLADYAPLASVETGYSTLEGYSTGYGELSLDAGRHRLYIGGDPVRIVDTHTLRTVAQVDGRGQVTPDPIGQRLYLTPPCKCRIEQCNTLILNAEMLTGTQKLFPPQDAFTAPCVVATRLDAQNQLLYAVIYNGVPGSNSGNYFSVLDVSGQPRQLYTTFDISYGDLALDPLRQRAFAPRYRIGRAFIGRFEARAGTITQTLELVNAHGQLAYDPQADRLYAVQPGALVVFDGDLTLLAEITLPGTLRLLDFDQHGQRLYLGGSDGDVWVVATHGGDLEPPPPVARGHEPGEGPSPDQLWPQKLVAAPDGTLFRVYGQRLYRSLDGGQSWDLLGRGLPGRLVTDVAVSPDYTRDHTLLVGLVGLDYMGGLYRSADGGDTWRPATRGLTDLGVQKIAFSPTYARDRTIFLTTVERGLFRSTDGGGTWTPLAARYATDAYDTQVAHLSISPIFADDELIIIGKDHLLRSADGGETWVDTRVPMGLVAFSPTFARDGLVLSAGEWLSTDRGQSWQPAAVGREPGIAQDMFFSPAFAADRTVYLLLSYNYQAALSLQRSVDAGRSWQSLLGGLPADFEIALARPLAAGALELTALDGRQVRVQAASLKWGQRPLDIAQLDLQALAIAPDGTLFLANSEAGVFKSTDAGRTWAETGFPARSTRFLRPAQLVIADDGTLFAAAGAALMRSQDLGRSWAYLEGVPPGFEIASLGVSPDFKADGVVLAGGSYSNRQMLRSADRGKSWRVVFDAATLGDAYASDIIAIAFSPAFVKDRTVYAWLQDAGLLRSADGGLTWRLMGENQYAYGQALAVAPDGKRLYLGALNGQLLVSEDGGKNWLELGDRIPDERAWSTALAFGERGTLFLGSDVGVYRSQDGGKTWARASAGLPLAPTQGGGQGVRALRFHQGRLYAAMAQGGLFVSDDLGVTWRSTLTGQPATPLETTPMATPGALTADEATPQPLALPSPAAPPDCPAPPTYFAELWATRRAELGCPVAALRLPLVEQSFEGGWMVWRSDTRMIYALPVAAPYAGFEDTWDESQPEYSCPDQFPSQTPPTPHRGFGKVWCREPLVREWLAAATGPERLFDATVQEFQSGLVFETDQGVTYILESGANAWERIE